MPTLTHCCCCCCCCCGCCRCLVILLFVGHLQLLLLLLLLSSVCVILSVDQFIGRAVGRVILLGGRAVHPVGLFLLLLSVMFLMLLLLVIQDCRSFCHTLGRSVGRLVLSCCLQLLQMLLGVWAVVLDRPVALAPVVIQRLVAARLLRALWRVFESLEYVHRGGPPAISIVVSTIPW